jgi:hypothetical protein
LINHKTNTPSALPKSCKKEVGTKNKSFIMKFFLVNLLLILISSNGYSQIGGTIIKYPYTAQDGTVFNAGDTAILGMGTGDQGMFKYVWQPGNSWLGTRGGYFTSIYNFKHIPIKELRSIGDKKSGYKTIAVVNVGGLNSLIDIESAIAVGELVTPNSKKKLDAKNQPIIIQQSNTSTADELKKLKDLLDQGIITKEEFDAQKAKLLAK